MTADPQAGPALDALISERVLGRPVRDVQHCKDWMFDTPTGEQHFGLGDTVCCRDWVPKYSTDPAAALAVVERLVEMRLWVTFRSPVLGDYRDWSVEIGRAGGNRLLCYAVADTFPLAIARAALAAVGEGEGA
jgi:hypothetical protein